jgi:hypothetical protein
MNDDQITQNDDTEIQEPEPTPGIVTIHPKADCMCFVETCPLHSMAAEMFIALNEAYNLAQEVGAGDGKIQIGGVIDTLGVTLGKLSDRVRLG